jgi:type IV secretion system protein VirB3
MAGQLVSDPLFVGLTRPSMIFGVSIQYAMLNLMISVTIFIQKSSVYIIFIAAEKNRQPNNNFYNSS